MDLPVAREPVRPMRIMVVVGDGGGVGVWGLQGGWGCGGWWWFWGRKAWGY